MSIYKTSEIRDERTDATAPPPPGCQVRGCCCGIPFGCGALAALFTLALSGALAVQRIPSQQADSAKTNALRATTQTIGLR